MAWAGHRADNGLNKSGAFHFSRTEADYSHLIALHDRYKLKKPPLEELKAAALADGYPPEKVAAFKYKDHSKINVERLLFPKRFKDEPVEDPDDDDEVNNAPTDDDNFDIDEFCSDNEAGNDDDYVSDDD